MVRSKYEIDLVIVEVVHQNTQMLYVNVMTQDTAAAEMLEQTRRFDTYAYHLWSRTSLLFSFQEITTTAIE